MGNQSVLRGFELVSGLGINFNKSKLVRITINSHFLEVAISFLSCRTELKEFTFFGIRIGSNPRRINSWRPMVEITRKQVHWVS